MGQLFLGQKLGVDFLDAYGIGHGVGGFGPVAGEHGGADTHGLGLGDGFGGTVFDGVRNQDVAQVPAALGNDDLSAVGFGDVGRQVDGESIHQLAVAAEDFFAVNRGTDAVTGDFLQGIGRGQGQSLGGCDDAAGDGVGGGLLAGGAQGQQALIADYLLDGEIALGDGAGLIHDHHLGLAHGFHHRAALEQDALLAAGTDAGEEGQRHAENQSAGAAHDQKRQGRIDPVAPVAGEQGGDYGDGRGGGHHDGGVDSGEAGDEPVQLGLASGGIFHEFQNLGDHGFGQNLFHPDGQLAGGVDAAGGDVVTGGDPHRHRLAGDGGGVDAALAGQHGAVQRDAVAGTNQQGIAGGGIGGGDGFGAVGSDTFHGLRPQVYRSHNLTAAAFHGTMLEIFTDSVEQHHAHGFGELVDAECADGGDGHEQILVKHPAPNQTLGGGFQNAEAQNQVGQDENEFRRQAKAQAIQHQAQDKAAGTAQELGKFFAGVVMAVFVATVIMVTVLVVMVGFLEVWGVGLFGYRYFRLDFGDDGLNLG